MPRDKFSHELAGGSKEATPEWVSDSRKELRIRRPDGTLEKWDSYREADENGILHHALPPAARIDGASISVKNKEG